MVVPDRSRKGTAVRAVIVASWFPSVEDTGKGRFVADQVAALRATGRVDPVVVSFQPARLAGGPLDRRRQAAAVRRSSARAIRSGVLFSPSGFAGPVGIPVARLPIPSGARGIGSPAHQAADREGALALAAPRLIGRFPTVIHAHTGYPDGAAATTLVGALEAPLVITEHASYLRRQLADPFLRRRYVGAARQASRLIAVSDDLAKEMRAALPAFAEKIVVVPNAVAVGEFPIGPQTRRDPDELLYVGHVIASKGMSELLEAFARVRATRPSAKLRLVGGSTGADVDVRWPQLAAELGVADAVRFDGPLLRQEVAAAMATASILVHPSPRETFGVAPVEALATGTPVVAIDTPALREILGPDDRRLGALVPPGDPGALARAILDTFGRRADFEPTTLRASVERRYGSGAVAERVADLYDAVLSEWGGRSPRPARTGSDTRSADRNESGAGRPTVVVGFDTAVLASRLAALPSSGLRDLRLVCSAGSAIADLPTGIGSLEAVEASEVWTTPPDPGSRPARRRLDLVAGFLTHSLRHLGAILHRPRIERLRVDAVTTVVASTEADGTSGPIDVICLDGPDYRTAERAIRHLQGRITPGIRWYADRVAGSTADV